jgi:DNA-binding beta-propeller fold protein YncE
MRKMLCGVGVMAAMMCLVPGHTIVGAAEGPYKLLKEIQIGGEGGWDYATVDVVNRRLYVSHATKVIVIDVDKDEVVGEIGPTPGVHGIAIAPELGLGFISNGGEAKAAIFDLKTLQITMKVDTGKNPDAILYEPGRQEVYAFNGGSNDATVFEAKTGKFVTTIKLSGKPEFAQADPKAGRVYTNIEDKNEIAVIDTKAHAVAASWPIAPGEGASGMAFDIARHRLFIGAGGANLMVMIDSTNGTVLGSVKIGPGVDANSYDPVTNYAFASSGGDGTVTVAEARSPTDFPIIQTLTTQVGCRTMTLDPKTHKLYLAAAAYEPAQPPEPGKPPARRRMVAGSFKVLVFRMPPRVVG